MGVPRNTTGLQITPVQCSRIERVPDSSAQLRQQCCSGHGKSTRTYKPPSRRFAPRISLLCSHMTDRATERPSLHRQSRGYGNILAGRRVRIPLFRWLGGMLRPVVIDGDHHALGPRAAWVRAKALDAVATQWGGHLVRPCTTFTSTIGRQPLRRGCSAVLCWTASSGTTPRGRSA
jgi:hypothetical protein